MQCDSHGVNIIAGKSSVGEESLKKKKKKKSVSEMPSLLKTS